MEKGAVGSSNTDISVTMIIAFVELPALLSSSAKEGRQNKRIYEPVTAGGRSSN